MNVILSLIYILDGIENLHSWADNDQHSVDLPDFSLSPQEYITQVIITLRLFFILQLCTKIIDKFRESRSKYTFFNITYLNSGGTIFDDFTTTLRTIT